MRDQFHWARILSFVTGLVNQELLLRNEYLAVENRILRAHLPARLRLSDAERSTLAEIAKRLGRKALQEIARVAKPDTLLAWYRQLVAHKFDGSGRRWAASRVTRTQGIPSRSASTFTASRNLSEICPSTTGEGTGLSNCSRMKNANPGPVASLPMYPFRYSRSRHSTSK